MSAAEYGEQKGLVVTASHGQPGGAAPVSLVRQDSGGVKMNVGRLSVCCAAMLWAAGAAAAPTEGQKLVSRSQVRVGLDWVSLHYREPGVMTEDGSLLGVCASYDLRRGWMAFQVSGGFAAGTVLYSGGCSIGDVDVAVNVDSPDALFNLRSSIGYAARVGADIDLVPYLGLGYRLLVDDLPDGLVCSGYRREQSYYYLPLGVVGEARRGKWRFGGRAEYDYFVKGVNNSGGDRFTQDSGYGLQCSIFAEYFDPAARPRMSYGVEPYVHYWNVDASTLAASLYYEPSNNNTLYGIRAWVGF